MSGSEGWDIDTQHLIIAPSFSAPHMESLVSSVTALCVIALCMNKCYLLFMCTYVSVQPGCRKVSQAPRDESEQR